MTRPTLEMHSAIFLRLSSNNFWILFQFVWKYGTWLLVNTTVWIPSEIILNQFHPFIQIDLEKRGGNEMVVRGRQNNNLGRGVLSGAGSLVKTQTIFKRRPATARWLRIKSTGVQQWAKSAYPKVAKAQNAGWTSLFLGDHQFLPLSAISINA